MTTRREGPDGAPDLMEALKDSVKRARRRSEEPGSGATVRELLAFLDAHRGVNLTAGWEGSPDSKDPRNIRRVCSCGALIGSLPYPQRGYFRLGGDPFDEPHREHVAEALALSGLMHKRRGDEED